MPDKSAAQEHLMQAAAHTKGGYGGVPQNVGKEFVGADSMSKQAAGIIFISGSKILLTRRGNGGDHPNEWAFPGGHLEDGESALQAAVRECDEEIGHLPQGLMTLQNDDGANFTAFYSKEGEFIPVLNYENTGYVWTELNEIPEPLHPGARTIIESDQFKQIMTSPRNELDVARKIQSGELTSPQKFANVWLFDIRITGTGTAYRSKGDEFTYRPPQHYMSDEFLARCNGLPVIWEHPENGVLNSDEFNDRMIGSIFLPYLKHEEEEVWGIAKIFDDAAAIEMTNEQLSTSPTVVFTKIDGNSIITVKDGTNVLIEGNPSMLDHVAICSAGVWDKGGVPSGVVSDSVNFGVQKMSEEEKKAAELAESKAKADSEAEAKTKADAEEKTNFNAKFDALMSAVDSMSKRMDSEFSKGEPKPVVADEEKAEEKAKADAAEGIAKRIDAVEAMIPKSISDDDYNAMADSQARADSVAGAFGESASRPQLGESVIGYRKRMAAKFKKHSKDYANIDIAAIKDDSLFSVVESKIYSDAMEAANSPIENVGGGLREIKTRSAAGHQISTFKGNISSWTNEFKADSFKVQAFNREVK